MKTTVGNALELISSELGLDPEVDRDEMLSMLNEIRSWIYSIYHRKAWAISYCECVTLEEFCLDCHECKDTYIGFTLPREIESIEGLHLNERPVSMRSGWRMWSDGVKDCPRQVTAYSLIEGVPTEREPDGCCSLKWKFLAECDDDKQKEIRVIYDVGGWARQYETIQLGEQWVETSFAVEKMREISLPSHTGRIIVVDANDKQLSIYRRGELAPSYTRVRVEGVCAGTQLKVIGPRKYLPVFDDLEILELGDPAVLKELARFVNLNSRENNDSSSRQEAEVHRRYAEDLMVGIIERERGTAAQARIQMPSTLSKSSTLYRPYFKAYRTGLHRYAKRR